MEAQIQDLAAFGKAIRTQREAARLTLDRAASLLGVSRRFLIELELGRRNAGLRTVLHVLEMLGLELHLKPRRPR